MQKRILITLSVVALLAIVLGLGTLQVSAQGPSNTYPGGALYIDEQWRTIPANTALWFIFEYTGDRSEIHLTLVDGFVSNLEMNVYHPEQVRPPDIINGDPVGRGSSAFFTSRDLTWAGRLYIAGTYYVQVVNSRGDAKSFQLRVAGSGTYVRLPTSTPTQPAGPTATLTRTRTTTSAAVAPNAVWTSMAVFAATMKAPLAADMGTGTPVTATVTPTATTQAAGATPTPTQTPVPSDTPTPTPTPTPSRLPAAEYLDANNFWPQSAIYVLDGRERIVPGSSALWFKFDYAGDGSLAEVRLPEGVARRLGFRVYSADSINRLGLNASPMGNGTTRPGSLDLTWSSRFIGATTIYVQVINDNSGQVNFNLVVSGPGVILGRGQP